MSDPSDDKPMTAADWRALGDLVMEVADMYHSGTDAERAVQLARKCYVRESALRQGRVVP